MKYIGWLIGYIAGWIELRAIRAVNGYDSGFGAFVNRGRKRVG